jgi:hypothetical protein
MSLPKDERLLAAMKSRFEYKRERITALRKTAELPAPWEKYPTYPRYCIGWRMGSGESFWEDWHDWFGSLSPEQRTAYRERHPEISQWAGFYEGVSKHSLPDVPEDQGPDVYWTSLLRHHESDVRRYEEYLHQT